MYLLFPDMCLFLGFPSKENLAKNTAKFSVAEN